MLKITLLLLAVAFAPASAEVPAAAADIAATCATPSLACMAACAPAATCLPTAAANSTCAGYAACAILRASKTPTVTPAAFSACKACTRCHGYKSECSAEADAVCNGCVTGSTYSTSGLDLVHTYGSKNVDLGACTPCVRCHGDAEKACDVKSDGACKQCAVNMFSFSGRDEETAPCVPCSVCAAGTYDDKSGCGKGGADTGSKTDRKCVPWTACAGRTDSTNTYTDASMKGTATADTTFKQVRFGESAGRLVFCMLKEIGVVL